MKTAARRKPAMLLWLVLLTSALMAVTTLLIVLSYRLMLEGYYARTLRRSLSDAYDTLQAADYSDAALARLRVNGFRVLLVDAQTGEILYEDMYFPDEHEKPDDRHAEGDRPGQPHPDDGAGMETRIAAQLTRLVDVRLGGEAGAFFSTTPLEREGGEEADGRVLDSKAIYLNGRDDICYYSLCLPMESVNAAVTLASRFVANIAILMWLLSLPAAYLIYRHITKPAKEVARTADQISKLELSVRCPPGNTREINNISNSINRMSDQLQRYVSELQTTNRRLSAELEQRERQQQLTSDLIANLSHDLKTPIAIISGYAEGLTEGLAQTEQQRALYAQTIWQESEHMQGVVNKMLALSRLEAGAEPVELSTFDLSELTTDVIRSFSREIERAGLRLQQHLTRPLAVCSDYERVRQVLLNYIQNSIYHINGGDTVRVVTARAGALARFCIANHSAPLTGEDADKLWEKLYRGSSARGRDHGEAGLGLCIVKQNMEQLGSGYGWRNLPEEGMVEFYIELPLAEGEQTDEPDNG